MKKTSLKKKKQMKNKSKLGSIFDDEPYEALLGEAAKSGEAAMLKITDIEPNRDQPRKTFSAEELSSLADSIRELGVIIPLIVRPYENTYQIVAGERRWRAARIAGLSEVPVRVMELDDVRTMEYALVENLQREDLNPIEEANGYRILIEKFDMTQDEAAKKVGKARSSVTNALRLLSLPADAAEMAADGRLSRGHCKVLLGTDDVGLISQLAQKVTEQGLSVKDTERLLKAATSVNSEQAAAKKQFGFSKNVFFEEARLSLESAIGKTVRVKQGKNRVTLEIDLSDGDELKSIANCLSTWSK